MQGGKCECCGGSLSRPRPNQKFCGKECAAAIQRQKWREQNPKSALGVLISSGIAEVNEMRVAIDLMARGCEVYRAAFQGMPCDMLIQRRQGWGWVRVEVTTGNKTVAGKVTHPERDTALFDVLAVVLSDGTICYEPEIGERNGN